MNYIQLINGFWLRHEEHEFLPIDCMLYFHLLDISNKLSWKHTYKRNNSKIMADLGIKDRRTLEGSRNRLKQAGLIDFCKISTNPNVTYTLTTALNAQADVQVSAQADVQVSAQVNDTKDKLNINQTKLNKTLKQFSNENCKSERFENSDFENSGKTKPKPETLPLKTQKKEKEKSSAKKEKESFGRFMERYKGEKRGLETEFENLREKHPKDWLEVVPVLENLDLSRYDSIEKRYIPHLKTFINNRNWESFQQSQPQDPQEIVPFNAEEFFKDVE